MNLLSHDLIQKVEDLAEKAAAQSGCRLYDWEFVVGGGQRVLRVFIDKSNSEGVSIDDCANVSRTLNEGLEVGGEDLIPGAAYQLEVSSPGLERKLKKPWHFENAVGSAVEVRLLKSLGELGVVEKKWAACKRFSGRLLSFAAPQATLETDDGTQVVLQMDAFEKIKTIFEMNSESKKKK